MRNIEMDRKIRNILDELQSFPPRDPVRAARGEADFLKQADEISSAVSREQETGLMGWIYTISSIFQRKERVPVLKPLFAVVIAVALLLGSTGATVYAAQDSLPDQALYPVKTWSEDALLSLAGSSGSRLMYDLDFSDRRITEIAGVLAKGNPVPEMAVTRLQNELQQALELAAGMDDPQMLQQLERIHLRAEAQLQRMTVLMSGASESAQPALLQVRNRIQQQVQLATMGQADPQGFKLQVQLHRQNQGGSGNQTPEPGNGPQEPTMQTPAGTPMPAGDGYGPGPGNGPQGPAMQTSSGTIVPPGNGNGSGMSGNQFTETPGQYGPGMRSPDSTPPSGGGAGKRP